MKPHWIFKLGAPERVLSLPVVLVSAVVAFFLWSRFHDSNHDLWLTCKKMSVPVL